MREDSPRGPALRKVFISYRREDSSGDARHVFEKLAQSFGSDRIFKDNVAIPPGEDFVEAIDRAIAESHVLIVVIGRRWLERDTSGQPRLYGPKDFVRGEIAAALKLNVHVVPVLVQGAEMPAADQLPDEIRPLARRQAIEISEDRWEFDIQRLTRALQERGVQPNRPVRGSWTASTRLYASSAGLLVAIAAGTLLGKGYLWGGSTEAPDPGVGFEEGSAPPQGGAGATGTFNALIPVPKDINPNLTAPSPYTMVTAFGRPGPLTRDCSTPTNPRVAALIVSEDVGPFRATGLKPAVDALRRVFTAVQQHSPELYRQIRVGSAGMLCMRARRGRDEFSNHSWGTAIDISVGNRIDRLGDGMTQVGVLQLYPFFHREGFYWGAGLTPEDAMHFEASAELIGRWQREERTGR